MFVFGRQLADTEFKAPNRLNSDSLVDLLYLMLYDSDEIRELIKPWGEHVTMPSNEVKYDVVDLLQDIVAERVTTPLQFLEKIEDEEEEIEASEDEETFSDEDVKGSEGLSDEMKAAEIKVE